VAPWSPCDGFRPDTLKVRMPRPDGHPGHQGRRSKDPFLPVFATSRGDSWASRVAALAPPSSATELARSWSSTVRPSVAGGGVGFLDVESGLCMDGRGSCIFIVRVPSVGAVEQRCVARAEPSKPILAFSPARRAYLQSFYKRRPPEPPPQAAIDVCPCLRWRRRWVNQPSRAHRLRTA